MEEFNQGNCRISFMLSYLSQHNEQYGHVQTPLKHMKFVQLFYLSLSISLNPRNQNITKLSIDFLFQINIL